jgi:signal transduction histidine kinase
VFQSARIKLTAWYLLIIMLISSLFSIVIYNGATRELQRFMIRIQRRQIPVNQPPPGFRPPITIEEIEEAKMRILFTLVGINVGIFLVAGGAAYFLAGRTLLPIKKMLDEQNRFIADASHELRTPLTALRAEMESNLLQSHLSEKESRNLISSNLEDVINLQRLSDSLLELVRYQNLQAKPMYSKIQLHLPISEAVKKVQPLAKQKKVTIINDAKDMTIISDEHALTQLLVVLLDNAIKYSPTNTNIYIRSEVPDHTLRLHIVDEGIGIKTEELPHIFERFYRADKSRSQTSGYGLGLAIAKKIVESQKGSITVKNNLEKGSTFTVQLPIKHSV